MLKICGGFAINYDLKFNTERSVAATWIGSCRSVKCAPLELTGEELQLVITDVTTPKKCHYTTLQNINFQKLFKETPAGELIEENCHARLSCLKQLLDDVIFIRFNNKKLSH